MKKYAIWPLVIAESLHSSAMDLWTRLWGRYHVPQNVFLVTTISFCRSVTEDQAGDLSYASPSQQELLLQDAMEFIAADTSKCTVALELRTNTIFTNTNCW